MASRDINTYLDAVAQPVRLEEISSPRLSPHHPARRLPVLVGLIIALLVIGPVAFVFSSRIQPTDGPHVTWSVIESPPTLPRAAHTSVWSGESLIVWGGQASERPLADGLSLSAPDLVWSPVPDSPLSARWGHGAVWTGSEMIVWGGRDGEEVLADGAAYQPSTGAWRGLAAAPLAGGRWAHVLVWTGDEMLVWGGHMLVSNNRYSASGAAYDPTQDLWRAISRSPLSHRMGASAVWTGTEMVVWGGVNEWGWLNDGAAYSPATDEWRMLPPSPLDPRQDPLAVWTGSTVLITGGIANVTSFGVGSAVYDPAADAWEVTGGPTKASPAIGAWIGDGVLRYDARSLFRDGRWTPLPDALPVVTGTGTWTGTEFVVIGDSTPHALLLTFSE